MDACCTCTLWQQMMADQGGTKELFAILAAETMGGSNEVCWTNAGFDLFQHQKIGLLSIIFYMN
jgi:hypothetical protein